MQDPFNQPDPQSPENGAPPLVLTSEDEAQAKKELNKAKKEAKKAKNAARKAAEKAADEADKAARKKREEELKVTVVNGQVVDQHGNSIRPYTRAEWFFDNKPLCYSVGAGLIVLFLVLSYFLTLETV